MSNEQRQQKATNLIKTANESLADFALEVFERARQLQNQRTGLMSNQDAMKMASIEYFAKGLADINNVTRIRGFSGERQKMSR